MQSAIIKVESNTTFYNGNADRTGELGLLVHYYKVGNKRFLSVGMAKAKADKETASVKVSNVLPIPVEKAKDAKEALNSLKGLIESGPEGMIIREYGTGNKAVLSIGSGCLRYEYKATDKNLEKGSNKVIDICPDDLTRLIESLKADKDFNLETELADLGLSAASKGTIGATL